MGRVGPQGVKTWAQASSSAFSSSHPHVAKWRFGELQEEPTWSMVPTGVQVKGPHLAPLFVGSQDAGF